jgi:Predicted transcriptional regulators
MNIIISDNLKELRKKKNNTQEDLAEFLTISSAAVSKWERGECYPDIELLPKIASYYDVSMDDLFGMGEIRKKDRIDEYMAKECEIFSQECDQVEQFTKRIALWREAQKEFPNNHTVLYQLINILFWETFNEDEGFKEAVEIGERLLRESTDNEIRFNTIYNLSFFHMKHGDLENAKKYADMIPGCQNSKEALYSRILSGEEAVEHNQRAIISYVKLVCDFAGSLWVNMQKEYSKTEIIKVLEFTLALNRLVYPDGDFDNEMDVFYNLYNLACFNLSIGETEKALSYLVELPEHFIKMFTGKTAKHTSFLVNKVEIIRYQSVKTIMLDGVSSTIQDLFENENRAFFDCVKNDERYITAIEKMKSLLK